MKDCCNHIYKPTICSNCDYEGCESKFLKENDELICPNCKLTGFNYETYSVNECKKCIHNVNKATSHKGDTNEQE